MNVLIVYIKQQTTVKVMTGDKQKKLKRTGVQIMPRAIPCTSSCDPRYGRGSLGAFARLGVRARKLGGLYEYTHSKEGNESR